MKKPLNVPLVVGLAIPFVMVVAVMLAIYVPSRYVAPAHDFVYVIDGTYPSSFYYAIHEGQIFRQQFNNPRTITNEPIPAKPNTPIIDLSLYRHDIKANTSTLISFKEARQLQLNPKLKSPDGYEIAQASGGGVFPFFYEGSHYNDRYIKNKYGSQKLNVEGDYNFQFLGWVIPTP